MKHNRKSTRLKNWDYGQDGAYFVTICTFEKMDMFGKVVKGEMVLNEIGKIVCLVWNEISNHYKNVEIDEFIVMPNHFHGIILLNGDLNKNDMSCRGAIHLLGRGAIHRAQDNTEGAMNRTEGAMNCARTRRVTLGKIIRYFKSKATKLIHDQVSKNHIWQRNYYDHIIRDDKDLNRVREYIIHNPIKWNLDEYYKK